MSEKIRIFNLEDFKDAITQDEILRICKSVFSYFSIEDYSLNIVCQSRDELKIMKKQYFTVDMYTDVISFIIDKNEKYLEGEIYISPEDIYQNSIEFETGYKNEFARIIIHGILHLFDYNDKSEKDKLEMTQMENMLLGRTGFNG